MVVSSAKKRPKTEVSRDVPIPRGKIPEDVANFVKKMMTFLTPEIREEARSANMMG